MARHFEHFPDFWLFYLSRHRSGVNRSLHVAAISGAAACLIGAGILEHVELAAIGLCGGYGLAWLGHLVEGCPPATFTRPVWSAQAAMLMYWRILTGRLGYDLMLAARRYPEAAED